MDAGRQRVLARVGPDVDRENQQLRSRVEELEAALQAARQAFDLMKEAVAARAAQEKAVWEWTKTPLEETGKRLWRALCTMADLHGESSLDLSLAYLGVLIGKSERAGRRAYDGDKGSPQTGLKASGLIHEIDRYKGRVRIELLDPLDVRRARVAIASLGQPEQSSLFGDDLGAKPEVAPADHCGKGEPASSDAATPDSRSDANGGETAGVAPYPPAVSARDGGRGAVPAVTAAGASPIHTSIEHENFRAHSHPHRPNHGSTGARAPAGGFDKNGGHGAVGDAAVAVVERVADRLVASARERADLLAAQIIAAVDDPDFGGLSEFAASLATAVEVDGEFPEHVARVLIQCVRIRQDGRQRIENPGGWFRASVRRRAFQIVQRTQDRRGNLGDAIQSLLETKRPQPPQPQPKPR